MSLMNQTSPLYFLPVSSELVACPFLTPQDKYILAFIKNGFSVFQDGVCTYRLNKLSIPKIAEILNVNANDVSISVLNGQRLGFIDLDDNVPTFNDYSLWGVFGKLYEKAYIRTYSPMDGYSQHEMEETAKLFQKVVAAIYKRIELAPSDAEFKVILIDSVKLLNGNVSDIYYKELVEDISSFEV